MASAQLTKGTELSSKLQPSVAGADKATGVRAARTSMTMQPPVAAPRLGKSKTKIVPVSRVMVATASAKAKSGQVPTPNAATPIRTVLTPQSTNITRVPNKALKHAASHALLTNLKAADITSRTAVNVKRDIVTNTSSFTSVENRAPTTTPSHISAKHKAQPTPAMLVEKVNIGVYDGGLEEDRKKPRPRLTEEAASALALDSSGGR
jgi:hypothetical protein